MKLDCEVTTETLGMLKAAFEYYSKNAKALKIDLHERSLMLHYGRCKYVCTEEKDMDDFLLELGNKIKEFETK